MPRESYAAQQAKIEKEITRLQKRAEALQTRRRKPVITDIVKLMREYGITPEEIVAAMGSAGKTTRTPRRKTAAETPAKRAVAPKYRHPQTGETWSGRGKAPRWLAAEESKGVSREDFLIK